MSGRWIACGGMLRAGSTLQYQIASELIERLGIGERESWHEAHAHDRLLATTPSSGFRTLKTHELTPSVEALCKAGKASALYIVRDVRDVICSLMRLQMTDFSCREIEEKVEVILRRDAAWRALPGTYVSRYEEASRSIVREVQCIADFLHLTPPTEVVRQIAEDLCYESQQRTLDAVENWHRASDTIVFDDFTLLHRRHLNGGTIGRYWEELRTDQLAVVEQIAGGWLREMGYPL